MNKYSIGGEKNTYKINPLFKDIKEYNKYLLSLIGIFVLLLTGIISYNYSNTSYAKWSSSVESKNIIKIHIKTGKSALEFAQANVGKGGLEKITHEIDNTLQVNNMFATEYRYRGGDSTVNNYITFNNEIWRIIGIIPTEDTDGNVENRFKIIKNESLYNANWNENGTNDWTAATLNTLLNNNYYNSLSNDFKNMIGTTKYYLGGYSSSNITTDIAWQYERKNEENRSEYYYETNPIMQNDAKKKIALMYASDYGYAASKECTATLYDYYSYTQCKQDNWIFKNDYEWLLFQIPNSSKGTFVIALGRVFNLKYVYAGEYATRPVLTLSSNVKISGGEGTSKSPYQLSIS